MSEKQEFKAEGVVYKPEISKCPPMPAPENTTNNAYVPEISKCPPYSPPDHPLHPANQAKQGTPEISKCPPQGHHDHKHN